MQPTKPYLGADDCWIDDIFPGLTLREQEVAQYLTQGCSNKLIAAELGVSQRTIEAHRARVFQKLRVRNAVELTGYYWQLRQGAATGRTPIDPRRLNTAQRAALIARGWDQYLPAESNETPAPACGHSAS